MQHTKGFGLVLCFIFSPALHAQTLQQRIAAAYDTANSLSHPTNYCSAYAQIPIRDPGFYWEIGDASGPLTDIHNGTVATQPPDPNHPDPIRTTGMSIASASKWVYAAYVAERFGATALTPRDMEFMTLSSGYHSLDNSCGQGSGVDTVDECLGQCSTPGDSTTCNNYFSNDAGGFYYDGGHFEAHAGSLNMFTSSLVYHGTRLGSDDDTDLALELQGYLSPGLHWMTFSEPVLAEGIATTPAGYIDHFLHNILSNSLQISSLLGKDAVCTNTNPNGNCPSAIYEPDSLRVSGESWHYPVGHWVEDDPNVGDGAFSSGGARGFYPWIWTHPRPGTTTAAGPPRCTASWHTSRARRIRTSTRPTPPSDGRRYCVAVPSARLF